MNKKKIFILLPTLALLLAGCGGNKANPSSGGGDTTPSTSDTGSQEVAVTGVSISQENLEVLIGENVTLIATIAPNNATNKKVTWATSDENVATVVNGRVTGVAAGQADITVTTQDGGFVATCHVTVPEPTEYGTEGHPLTPEQTYALIADMEHQEYSPEPVWCEGVVFSSLWNSSYSSFNGWLQRAGATETDDPVDQGIQLYGVALDESIENQFEAENALVGYTVKIHGYIEKYGTTCEFTSKTVGEDKIAPTIKALKAPSGAATGVRLLSADSKLFFNPTYFFDEMKLDSRLIPLSAAGTVEYVSDTPEKAKVENGKVVAVAAGTAKIKAKVGSIESEPITITVEQVSYINKCDFTTKAASNSSYDNSWNYGSWKIKNGANNNAGWAYVKFGKKSTSQICTATSPLIAPEPSKVTVEFPAHTISNKTTINEWGVKVYSDAACETLVATVKGGALSGSVAAGSVDLVPASGTPWGANRYYQVYFDINNSANSSNGALWVSSITIA